MKTDKSLRKSCSMLRRVALSVVSCVFTALACTADPSQAQSLHSPYPVKPVRVVVPLAAGSGWDVMVRRLAQDVSKALGQPIIVENRPGAGGTLGAQFVARAPADGYTILAGSVAELCVAPAVYARLPYDPQRDFVPITQVAYGTLILFVAASHEARSIGELLALAKAKPGQLTAASYGNGTLTHLLIGELSRVTGVKLIHVPYKSFNEALNDVMSGRVTMMFDFWTTSGPFVESGKLRPLLVANARRHRALPETPTAAEAGLPTLTHQPWGGFLAPVGTPGHIVEKLNQEFVKAALLPTFHQTANAAGVDVVASTSEAFAALIRQQQTDFQRVAKEAEIALH